MHTCILVNFIITVQYKFFYIIQDREITGCMNILQCLVQLLISPKTLECNSSETINLAKKPELKTILYKSAANSDFKWNV